MKWVLLLTAGVLVGVSLLPVEATQPTPFADPSFSRFFARATPAGQTMLWGGAPLVSVVEPYTGAPGNRRLVQYFDRGRMELDVADRSVTEGLLVREMTTGKIQLGADEFVQYDPPTIPILSTSATADGNAGPTYADFNLLVATRAADRSATSDAVIKEWIQPGGSVVLGVPPVTISTAQYVEQTGHNIAGVFVAWMSSDPFGSISWQDALGYPISEPYWVRAGDRDRLVQLFERRVAVYTPSLPTSEQYSLTNAGRHYYRWRYGAEPTSTRASDRSDDSAPAADDNLGLVLPAGYHASVLLRDAGDIVDLSVTSSGRLLLAHAGGSVSLLDPQHPADGTRKPLIDGLTAPEAVASVGTSIFVVDSAGLHRYEDHDGDGAIDATAVTVPLSLVPGSVTMALGPNGALYLSGVEQGQLNAGSPVLLVWDESSRQLNRLAVQFPMRGTFVVDASGVIWAADTSGRLIELSVDARQRETLALQGIGTPSAEITGSGVHDLLLYRPDGTIGDPLSDLLALVSDAGDGGRVVRLRPAAGGPGTPDAHARSGAIVDFITGFKRPVAIAAGFDGSLYIADTGSALLYRITPP